VPPRGDAVGYIEKSISKWGLRYYSRDVGIKSTDAKTAHAYKFRRVSSGYGRRLENGVVLVIGCQVPAILKL
jgi:hypothetical protein